MSTFDPGMAAKSIAPDLSKEQRLDYVHREREFIEDLLEDAEDSKWVYQALVECAVLESKLVGSLPMSVMESIGQWLEKLKQIDPLRKGRWDDMASRCPEKDTRCKEYRNHRRWPPWCP